MPKTNADWLNNFVEKNAVIIISTVVSLVVAWTLMGSRVKAVEVRLATVEAAQQLIIENQRAIIQLQATQANIQKDVDEIKSDVKTLLRRPE